MNSPIQSRFSSWAQKDEALARAAKVAVSESIKAQRDEKLIIIANPTLESSLISFALYDAATEAGACASIIFQPIKGQMDFAEEVVIRAFDSNPDILMSISANKMGKDREGIATPYEWNNVSYDHVFHYQLNGAKTLRAFWSPGITRDIFARTVPIDYATLRQRAARVKRALDEAVAVRVTTDKGTDITLGLRGRLAFVDDGDFSRPGMGGNIPSGESFISPELGTAKGSIVMDASVSTVEGDIVIREPIRLKVESGFVTEIAGGEEARILQKSIEGAEARAIELGKDGKLAPESVENYRKNARALGEFGIGLNPEARVSGNMLEDEKAFRTCHFAIGSNYDDDAPALIHLDGLVSEPTIVAIMGDGKEVFIEQHGDFSL